MHADASEVAIWRQNPTSRCWMRTKAFSDIVDTSYYGSKTLHQERKMMPKTSSKAPKPAQKHPPSYQNDAKNDHQKPNRRFLRVPKIALGITRVGTHYPPLWPEMLSSIAFWSRCSDLMPPTNATQRDAQEATKTKEECFNKLWLQQPSNHAKKSCANTYKATALPPSETHGRQCRMIIVIVTLFLMTTR